MGVETFSWGRYFNRIRNYPLTTAGAAHDAAADIYQVLRSMRPSPWFCPCSIWSPPPTYPGEFSIKKKEIKIGYCREERICVKNWSFFYIESNWHLLTTIRIPPHTPQRMLQIPSPPPSPHACAYSPAYLAAIFRLRLYISPWKLYYVDLH